MIIYNLFPLWTGNVRDWTPRLHRAADLGFDWVFINPIHYPGFSGSLYSVKDYFSMNPLSVFLKVIYELLRQVSGRFIVRFLVGPGIAWIQYVFGHIRTAYRHGHAKNGVDLKIYIGQLSLKRSADHGARIGQLHTVANAISAARPAGIDQPNGYLVRS